MREAVRIETKSHVHSFKVGIDGPAGEVSWRRQMRRRLHELSDGNPKQHSFDKPRSKAPYTERHASSIQLARMLSSWLKTCL